MNNIFFISLERFFLCKKNYKMINKTNKMLLTLIAIAALSKSS